MASFDSLNYDITEKLPEWWKGFGALEPINQRTQELISELLEGLLTNIGVVQPLNCWLSIPEEYNWYHHYKPTDDYLEQYDERGNIIITERAVTTLFENGTMHAILPNTKRKCHAKIKLKLLGTEIPRTDDGKIDKSGRKLSEETEIIPTLKITNADQEIILHNITSTSTIEISTETNEILIDKESNPNLIEGKFDKIKPTIKNIYYQVPYIDKTNQYQPATIEPITCSSENLSKKKFFLPKKIEKENPNAIYEIFGQEKNKPYEKKYFIKISSIIREDENPIYECIFCDKNGEEEYGTGIIKTFGPLEQNIKRYRDTELEEENKETKIILNSDKTVNFDLQVYLYKPTYTTEQNIKVSSVSAFPIERIELYGYFCHPFNNKSGYKYVWGKDYSKESRTIYERVTLQQDCERFYITVKFHGIGVTLKKGFPQSAIESNAAFQLNPALDKWGKIYGLPRRIYKSDITEDEEPFTFPKYYNYPIEQDYWYEERLINEYKFEDDAVNSLFIKDNEFNNIGMLECVYPFMNDIWVYTETIDPQNDKTQRVSNEYRNDIPLCSIEQKEDSLGADWNKPEDLIQKPISIKLNPKSEKVIKQNDFSYQTKKIKCSFCLNDFDDSTPKNINIKGIELKFKTETSVQSNTIKLSDDSKIIIPYPNPNPDSNDGNYILEKINIIKDELWVKENGYYIIGGENNLFSEKKITREQLFKGNDGKVEFELAFVNENNFLESYLYLENVTLNIYYDVIPDEYSIDVTFDKKEINLSNNDNHRIHMFIDIKNIGETEVHDKELIIIVPPEITIQEGYNNYLLNLDIGEVCDTIDILLKPTENNGEIETGWYDILVICDDKVFSNEILVRGSGL